MKKVSLNFVFCLSNSLSYPCFLIPVYYYKDKYYLACGDKYIDDFIEIKNINNFKYKIYENINEKYKIGDPMLYSLSISPDLNIIGNFSLILHAITENNLLKTVHEMKKEIDLFTAKSFYYFSKNYLKWYQLLKDIDLNLFKSIQQWILFELDNVKNILKNLVYSNEAGNKNISYLIVNGEISLCGELNKISGSADSAVINILLSLLFNRQLIISNVPNVQKIHETLDILDQLNVQYQYENHVFTKLNNLIPHPFQINYINSIELFFILCNILAIKFKQITINIPHTIDKEKLFYYCEYYKLFHINYNIRNEKIEICLKESTENLKIFLDDIDNCLTINAIILSLYHKGKTILVNTSSEPYIMDNINFLNSLGAKIYGAGTREIDIIGFEEIKTTDFYETIPDYNEAAIFMIAAALTGGHIKLNNVIPKHLRPLTLKLREIGVFIEEIDDSIYVISNKNNILPVYIETYHHPGIRGELLLYLCSLLSASDGISLIHDKIFDYEQKDVDELKKFGVNITYHEHQKRYTIHGIKNLKAADIYSNSSEQSIASILLGLASSGETRIISAYNIENKYENIIQMFNSLGAEIYHFY